MRATAFIAALVAAVSVASPVGYVESRQLPDGGFAEPGGRSSIGLTAWAVLALRAADARPNPAARRYLAQREPATETELALVLMARAATGEAPDALVGRLRALERSSGAIGSSVNSTAWGVLALRQAREAVRPTTARYLLRHQTRSGGWGWTPGMPPDSNDTAAVVQALRALGVRGRPIRRAIAFLRSHRNRDGGFALARGRASDAQSTAWAIQAFLAARVPVPKGAFGYLARLQRRDGSYRYSQRYGATPLWVTAQVVPAVMRKPFPLR